MAMETIQIERFEVKKFRVKIKGLSDLLMHGKTPKWLEWYEKERDKKKGEKSIDKPEEEAERGVYKDRDGNPIIPAGNIYRMLRDAFGTLTGFASGYKKGFDTSVSIFPDEIPLKFKRKELDKRKVVIGRNIPDFRHRYKFSGWEAEFDVLLRSTLALNEKKFFSVLEFAGQFVGLMDGKSIGFGRFEIKNENK